MNFEYESHIWYLPFSVTWVNQLKKDFPLVTNDLAACKATNRNNHCLQIVFEFLSGTVLKAITIEQCGDSDCNE